MEIDYEKLTKALEKVATQEVHRLEDLVRRVYDDHAQISKRLNRLENELPEKCPNCGRRG